VARAALAVAAGGLAAADRPAGAVGGRRLRAGGAPADGRAGRRSGDAHRALRGLGRIRAAVLPGRLVARARVRRGGRAASSLTAQQALAVEAIALAVVAAVLPLAAAHGRWGRVGAASFLLAATILSAPAAAALPLVLAAWVTWAALTLAGRASA